MDEPKPDPLAHLVGLLGDPDIDVTPLLKALCPSQDAPLIPDVPKAA